MTRRTPAQYNWNKLLFDEQLLTKHFTVQSSKKLSAVVFHHMVVRDMDPNKPDALDAVYNIWQTRPASAQYGVDGRFVRQFVNDKDYAWATGSTHGNQTSINIEMVNSTLDEPGTDRDYMVSETTWKTAAKLAAHILKAYGLKPIKNVTVRKHSSYFATACPGPYVDRIWDKIFAEIVRVYNGGSTSTPEQPRPEPLDLGEDVKLIRDEKGGIYYIYEMGYYHIKDPAQADAAVKLWGKPIQVSNGHRSYHIKAAEGRVRRLKSALGIK